MQPFYFFKNFFYNNYGSNKKSKFQKGIYTMVTDERANEIMKKVTELADEVLSLEAELTEEEGEQLRDFLLWCGYDVKHYGSYYPLILTAIRNEINPN